MMKDLQEVEDYDLNTQGSHGETPVISFFPFNFHLSLSNLLSFYTNLNKMFYTSEFYYQIKIV